MSRSITTAKVLLTATSLWAGVGAFVFDWNETQIHNPTWPGHAKFHNAQTMSLGASLGAVGVAAAWWPRSRWSLQHLRLATGAASMYWFTQLTASAYPETTMLDDPVRRFGPQTGVAGAEHPRLHPGSRSPAAAAMTLQRRAHPHTTASVLHAIAVDSPHCQTGPEQVGPGTSAHGSPTAARRRGSRLRTSASRPLTVSGVPER